MFALEQLLTQEVPNQYFLNKTINNKALSEEGESTEETRGSGWARARMPRGGHLSVYYPIATPFYELQPIFLQIQTLPSHENAGGTVERADTLSVEGQPLIHTGLVGGCPGL